MAMSKWIGYAVSVNCGEPLGCYQGTILKADSDGATITLNKAFRNGFPYPKSQVTLNAADIKDLKIIEARSEPSEQTHSTVAVLKGSKKSQRATVCENLQANPSSSGNQIFVNAGNNSKSSVQRSNVAPARNNNAAAAPRGGSGGSAASKPIDIQPATAAKSYRNNHPTGSFPVSGGGGGGGSTPRAGCGPGGGAGGSTPRAGCGPGGAARRRNEACFGEALEPDIHTEFDFEKNLALFDKQALWEQMRAQKPDLVRQTEAGGGKYRHDENILGGGAAGAGGAGSAGSAISIPVQRRGPITYVTGCGVSVESARRSTRAALLAALPTAALLLLARAAADVALRLVGGERRLDARNAHQAPVVVALVGHHRVGSCGLATARLLASHGVRVCAWSAGGGAGCGGGSGSAGAGAGGASEWEALAAGGGRSVNSLGKLPSPDLVLLALHEDYYQTDYSDAIQWVSSQSRSSVVCIEPPPAGYVTPPGSGGGDAGGETLPARATVVAVLPPALHPALGQLYLANVAPPLSIFADLNITYRPPFGASSVLALYPRDD